MGHISEEKKSLSMIEASWQRCEQRYQLRAGKAPKNSVLTASQMRQTLEKSEEIHQIVIPELELLYNQIAGTNFMVAYADADGVVIDSLQDSDFQAGEGGRAVIPGSIWTEQYRGTNALGLALHTRQSQIVSGADHYFNSLKSLSCFAAPIFDHEDSIVGVIDATSDAQARNEHTLALVNLAARNIEHKMFSNDFQNSIILSFHARPEYLRTSSVALIAVDYYGIIQGANQNARSMLGGLNLTRTQIFGDVFEVPFSTIIDQLSSNEVVQIRDVMGSVVFMRIQHSLSRPVVRATTPGKAGPAKAASQENRADRPDERPQDTGTAKQTGTGQPLVFHDEILKKRLKSAKKAIGLGANILIEGQTGSGRTALARALAEDSAQGVQPVLIDARLTHEKLFADRLAALLAETEAGQEIRLIIDNVEGLATASCTHLLDAISHQAERPASGTARKFGSIILTGPPGWTASTGTGLAPQFLETIAGFRIVLPDLGQRTDFSQICHALMRRLSDEHKLAKSALDYLASQHWPRNISELVQKLQMAVIEAENQVIRKESLSRLEENSNPDISPCQHCVGSPLKAENCIRIKKIWVQADRNVSSASRISGLSRNTIYKHLD